MKKLYYAEFQTPIGHVVVRHDTKAVHALEFMALCRMGTPVPPAWARSLEVVDCALLEMLSSQLKAYFTGNCHEFTLPLQLSGTLFQKNVWNTLLKVPYGTTGSYKELARAIGNEKACRAVAGANSANKIALLIPCHRIIGAKGDLRGYAYGQERKKWLLEHERTYR